MMKQEQSIADAGRVRQLLLDWATAARTGARDAILQGHDPDVLVVVAGSDVAFASGLIKCGGTLLDDRTFEDLVRATFCLQKRSGEWLVTHQHISRPAGG
ncbi:MAG: hypothetical protein AB1437_18895 [Pseudomonadota bacterium]